LNFLAAKKSGEARKQAGKKERGLGEGIFARLPRAGTALQPVSNISQANKIH